MGPSLRDAVWIYGGDDAHIYASIAQGRANGMPTWGAKIPEQEIWQLVAYIKSLRTPDEPEPPE
jgi:cytochrome c oxidase cbb3-type subunit 3